MFVGWEGGAVAESNILRVNDKCKLCIDLLNVPEGSLTPHPHTLIPTSYIHVCVRKNCYVSTAWLLIHSYSDQLAIQKHLSLSAQIISGQRGVPGWLACLQTACTPDCIHRYRMWRSLRSVNIFLHTTSFPQWSSSTSISLAKLSYHLFFLELKAYHHDEDTQINIYKLKCLDNSYLSGFNSWLLFFGPFF